eukprot:gene6753-8374_t
MDTSQSDVINYLFLNLTDSFDREMTPQLYISYKPANEGFSKPFSGYWDSNLELFVIPFYIEKQFPQTPQLEYYLLSTLKIYQNMLYSKFGPNTTVSIQTNKSDYLAPIISDIKIQDQIVNGSFVRIGWNVTIEDEINGFSNGYFEIMSNLDVLPLKISFDRNDRILGDEFLGVYNVSFVVDKNACVPQIFTVSKVYLDQFNSSEFIYRDPYLKVGILPDIESPCTVLSYNDQDPPTLTSFSGKPQFIDVSNQDISQRQFTITFSTDDSVSGISERHNPMVYIQSLSAKPIGFQSKFLTKTGTIFNYQCDIIVPYRFGDGNNISLSIYRIVDKALNIIGYPSSTLSDLFPTQVFIERRTTTSEPLIYELDFLNETTILSTDFKRITSIMVGIEVPPFNTNEFLVTIKEGTSRVSNSLRVFANTHEYKSQYTPPPTPSPSTPPPTPSQTPPQSPSPTPPPTLAPIPCPGQCYDPDFSILTDYESASKNSDSICKPSKLSTAKIIAIAVCSGLFLATIIIGSVIFIKKRKKYKKRSKDLKLKLKNLNQ